MNEINNAIEQLSEIHHHLSKNNVYRGYKSYIIAFSAVIAIIAMFLFSLFNFPVMSKKFVAYWGAVAALNLFICTLMIMYQYFFKETELQKKHTVKVMIQFIPMLIAGIIVTGAISLYSNKMIILLPGLWALLFGMGIFNVRPYLSNLTIIPAGFYFGAAGFLFYLTFLDTDLLNLGLGTVFAIGQFLSAVVLYFSIERVK